jgi:hypothetical protein
MVGLESGSLRSVFKNVRDSGQINLFSFSLRGDSTSTVKRLHRCDKAKGLLTLKSPTTSGRHCEYKSMAGELSQAVIKSKREGLLAGALK